MNRMSKSDFQLFVVLAILTILLNVIAIALILKNHFGG